MSGDVAIGECASCGSPDGEVTPVRRAYLIPEPRLCDEVEWWCLPCRTQYPHEDVAGA